MGEETELLRYHKGPYMATNTEISRIYKGISTNKKGKPLLYGQEILLDNEYIRSFITTVITRVDVKLFRVLESTGVIKEVMKSKDTRIIIIKLAITGGNLEILKGVLQHVNNIDLAEKKLGVSLVHQAALLQNFDMIRMLIRYKATKSVITKQAGQGILSPLHEAIWSVNITRYLVSEGFNVNELDEIGRTPLQYAVEMNAIDAVHYYISETSVDIYHVQDNGQTAIDTVLRNADNTIMRYLFDTEDKIRDKVKLENLYRKQP